jgi:hypothetical protein
MSISLSFETVIYRSFRPSDTTSIKSFHHFINKPGYGRRDSIAWDWDWPG